MPAERQKTVVQRMREFRLRYAAMTQAERDRLLSDEKEENGDEPDQEDIRAEASA